MIEHLALLHERGMCTASLPIVTVPFARWPFGANMMIIMLSRASAEEGLKEPNLCACPALSVDACYHIVLGCDLCTSLAAAVSDPGVCYGLAHLTTLASDPHPRGPTGTGPTLPSQHGHCPGSRVAAYTTADGGRNLAAATGAAAGRAGLRESPGAVLTHCRAHRMESHQVDVLLLRLTRKNAVVAALHESMCRAL